MIRFYVVAIDSNLPISLKATQMPANAASAMKLLSEDEFDGMNIPQTKSELREHLQMQRGGLLSPELKDYAEKKRQERLANDDSEDAATWDRPSDELSLGDGPDNHFSPGEYDERNPPPPDDNYFAT